MLGITSTGSRLRLDSFNVKNLDPSISVKFCVTQYRRGLFGFSNQRYVILHLRELSMNVVDKKVIDSNKSEGFKIKSYKTAGITRLAKNTGTTSIRVHMQRNGGEEVVKEYTFASEQDRDMFERTVNVMNRYGTVVNHVFDESVTKAVKDNRFSYAALTKLISDCVGHDIPKDTWLKLCGPEDNSIASVNLRQLFRVIGNADEATMMPTTTVAVNVIRCTENDSATCSALVSTPDTRAPSATALNNCFGCME